MLEYLALIAENELLWIENEKFKALPCPYTTQKGTRCKNNLTCRFHGVSSVLRKWGAMSFHLWSQPLSWMYEDVVHEGKVDVSDV